MKVLVTGACGQLGSDVIPENCSCGFEAVATDVLFKATVLPESTKYVQLDITDYTAVKNTLIEINPDAVIHCAAWTAVDAVEEPENRDVVFAIKADGTRNISDAYREIGCKMLYLSTDYVFDGQG